MSVIIVGGYSISAVLGANYTTVYMIRELSPCGVVGLRLYGPYPTEEAARAVVARLTAEKEAAIAALEG